LNHSRNTRGTSSAWSITEIAKRRVARSQSRSSSRSILQTSRTSSDLGDTINRIDSTGFAEVEDLSLRMPGIDEPSSAYMRIRATGKEEIAKSLSILRHVGAEKDLLVIEPIEAEKI
jgi:ACT domain-containing protein